MSAELTPARRRQLMLAAGLGVVLAVILPFALAGGLGRFVGGLWVTVMGAIISLVGALFGG